RRPMATTLLRFPAVHERVLTPYELALLQPRRQQLLAQARGTVVDLGGGTGAHLSWYPPAVDDVVVLRPDPVRRALVERRAAGSTTPTVVVDAASEAGLTDGQVDVVVAQLVLCAVPDQVDLLIRLKKLLRPGGRLLFLEHVPPKGDSGIVRSLS